MKNIVKLVFIAVVTSSTLISCLPDDDYSLGSSETATLEQVTFTYAPTDRSPNVIQFTNTSTVKGIYSLMWDLGNGASSTAQNPVGTYPDAGVYMVSLTVKTYDGNVVVRTQEISIANDDPTLFDTEVYRNLTRDKDDNDGKTWVFDQYNLYTADVKEALNKDIRGHMGLGSFGSVSQEWWGAGPNEKAYESTLNSVGHGWTLYEWKLTFSMASGLNLEIETGGEGYGRNAIKDGFPFVWNNGDDMAFPFNGGNFAYSLANAGDDDDGYPELTLADNAFLGYHVGTQVYEIIYLTTEVMAIRAPNTVENQDWVFIFIREDLNVDNPPPPKELKAVPLFENFEGTELKAPLTFDNEDMGSLTNYFYQNPAPVPINSSKKVVLYEKTNALYSNISYTTKDYKFDLSEQNMIRMKVFLPGFNNYSAGGLQKAVAVKLQNSSRGGSAWETQTEIKYSDLPTDTWLSLTFDFSTVRAGESENYDKIVIQFGDEGHNRSGIFFFDDLKFDVYDEEEDPNVVFLSGGKDNENGKSWKLRPHTQGSGIIMTRTWTGEVWWTVDAGAAGSEAAYDDVITFFHDGKAKIENNGDSFMNESTGSLFSDGDTEGSFVTREYVPAEDATWEFADVGGVPNLMLTKVFPMYAVSPDAMQEGYYEIVSISENLLAIKYIAGTGEWDVTWNYYLVPVE